MQTLKDKMILFTLGVMLGGLLGIAITYPVTTTTIQTVQAVCKQQAFSKFKVGISGKVYEVTCLDGQTYYLK